VIDREMRQSEDIQREEVDLSEGVTEKGERDQTKRLSSE
jgi:hypothetical protein